MWSPWRQFAEEFPEWEFRFGDLPDDVDGLTDHRHRIVWIERTLLQAARRSVMAHELEHVRGGHDIACCVGLENLVEETAARNLIPLRALIDALMWTTSLYEAAELLHVDTGTLAMRMRRLHASETGALRRRWARKQETA